MGVSRRTESDDGRLTREAGARPSGLQESGLLRTKLDRPPVAPDIYPRARLLQKLDGWRHRPLTLICAPAGYGKSTLASRWVAQCGSPSAWVTLDESDSDLSLFLGYLVAAIHSLSPTTKLRTESLVAAGTLPPVSVVARYWLNDLHELEAPFLLVLDDLHHVRGQPVYDLLTEILTHPPRGMHLVLVTRRDPPLPITKLRARGQVREIRIADLRFDRDETAAFARNMLAVTIDDAAAALLQEKTEGWAAGLRLAALYLRGQEDLMRSVQGLRGSSGHVAEYLAAEVLSRQTPEIKAYLLESSILDRFSAPLCQALHLSGVEGRTEAALNAQRFIAWLIEMNLFVIPLDDQGIWFRYHHLFREFLQIALRKQNSPKAIARLHLRACRWLEEEGLLDEALGHALAAGDAEAAVRLVIRHRHHLIDTSQFRRLYRWLDRLPAETVIESPLLTTTRALLGIELGLDADIHTCVEQASRMLASLPPESGEHAVLEGELAAVQCVVAIIRGDSSSILAEAQSALRRLPVQAMFARSLAFGAMACARQIEGNTAQGLKMVTDALAASAWPINVRARMWFYLAIVNFLDANLTGAISASRESLRILGNSQFSHTRSFARYFLGSVHHLRNERSEAQPYLLGVLEDRFEANPSYVVHAGCALASIYLAESRPADAERVIDLLDDHFREIKHFYGSSITAAYRTELALRQGKVDEARRLSMGVDFNPRPPLWFSYMPQLTPIKLLFVDGAVGGLEEARTRLDDLEEQLRRLNRKWALIDVLALQTLVYHKLADGAAARKRLRAVVDLARPGGFIRNFADLGEPMAELLAGLQESCPADGFVEKLVAACTTEARGAKALLAPPPVTPKSGRMPVTTDLLTYRECELLMLLGEGLSNKEIGSRLHIATETVKTHLRNVYRKLGVDGRFAALRKAGLLGMVAPRANEIESDGAKNIP